MSSAVARAIGADKATTFDLSNACAGMLTGVTVLNNWIRQGTVERGLVVSGEYISQLGQNAAGHVRSIMSKEVACLTLGDAGAALILERAPTGSAGISLVGFTTVADYSRLYRSTGSPSQTTRECIPPPWWPRSCVRPRNSRSGARVLLIAAGAGVTAGAALYREAPAGPLDPRVGDQCPKTKRDRTQYRPA